MWQGIPVLTWPQSQFAMHNSQPHSQARTAKELTLKELVVSCVSEVCKSSSSELLQKVLSSGYRSVNNYENPPVRGSWGEIDTSQHGYGNGNRTTQQRVGNMPSRYQDWLIFAFIIYDWILFKSIIKIYFTPELLYNLPFLSLCFDAENLGMNELEQVFVKNCCYRL